MADVRTLLQREREARRIQHPYLSYSKSGALTCTVCNLNIKSEALWEGHLKSANHRKNLRDTTTNTGDVGHGKKRKIEELAEEDNPRKRKTVEEESEGDGRKKRQVSFQATEPDSPSPEDKPDVQKTEPDVLPGFVKSAAIAAQTTPTPSPSPPPAAAAPQPVINEDEWAAFEAEVAPLARPQPQDYSNATISAAPVSADELAAQQAATSRRSRRDEEAEAEKEESEQRLADEFDVMEEMEERVRRLKEKREALRTARPTAAPAPAPASAQEEPPEEARKPPDAEPESESDDDEDVDEDDWFS